MIGGKVVQKRIDLSDVKDVDNYILLTRSLGSNYIVPEAKELIIGIDYSKDCLMVEGQNEKWLISRIMRFPLKQEACTFELAINDRVESLREQSGKLIW